MTGECRQLRELLGNVRSSVKRVVAGCKGVQVGWRTLEREEQRTWRKGWENSREAG